MEMTLEQLQQNSRAEFEKLIMTLPIYVGKTPISVVTDFLASREKLNSLASLVIERVREKMPKVITPTVEPPPNKLSQNLVFAGGQVNMEMRVLEVLTELEKEMK